VVDDVYQALYSIYSQKRRGATEQPATITQLRGTNKILVTCTEKQYTEIEALIKQLDVVSEAAARVEIVNLHRISPQEAYNILIEFFRKPGGARWDATLVSDLRIIPSESTSSLLVTGREEGVDRVVALAKKLDAEAEEGVEGARETKVIALKYAYPGYAANAIVQALSKPGQQAEIDRITAVPETYTNTIIVSASEENMKKIDEIVAQLDRDPANAQTRHIVALKNAQADDVATAITQAYRYRSTSRRNERPVTVVPEANSNQLIVTCRPDEYEGVKQLIETLDVPKAAEADRIIKTFRLTYVEPSSLSSAINVAFQTRTGRQNPRDVVTSTYDYTSGTLIVVASKERMAQVEELVAEMDTESETKRDVHVVELQNADAADVANSLTQMFVYGGQRARGGQYAVQVTHIAGTDRILIKANDSQFAEIQGIVAKLDSPDLGAGDVMEVVLLEHADAVETESILQTVLRKSGGRSGQLTGDVRLSVSATSNAVVVSGGREQVDNVVKLVKTLDTESEGAGAPQRIELKYANASQLAETLRDVFTDPAQRRRGRSQEMVPLIIADEPSNSLIVRARLSDFTLISRMVEDLDREEMTGEGTIKVIAVDPGMNVTDLARELENTINEGQRLKAAQTPGMRPMQVSIGSDTRTNTLLVSGSPALYPEVEKLIKTLEAIKPASGTGVLILPLRNVSPDDLKRVIDQMQRQRQGRLRGRRGAVDSKDTALGSWLRSCA
jgi:type II secretory pathway component GspD/PulD (secretin)